MGERAAGTMPLGDASGAICSISAMGEEGGSSPPRRLTLEILALVPIAAAVFGSIADVLGVASGLSWWRTLLLIVFVLAVVSGVWLLRTLTGRRRLVVVAFGVVAALAVGATFLVPNDDTPQVSADGLKQSGPPRQVMTYFDGMDGFDYITFNSFTGVPGIGDERNFVNARTPDSLYWNELHELHRGDIVELQVYVDNDVDSSLATAHSNSSIARDVTLRVEVPAAVATEHRPVAYLFSSNSVPNEIFDDVSLELADGAPFQVEYVANSANQKGNFLSEALNDSIAGPSGVRLSSKGADGEVGPGFSENILITLQLRIA